MAWQEDRFLVEELCKKIVKEENVRNKEVMTKALEDFHNRLLDLEKKVLDQPMKEDVKFKPKSKLQD